MKNKAIYYVGGALLTLSLMTACSDDDLDSTSVITVDNVEQNAFDKWLDANYVTPYNIEFKYRYEANEGDFNYYQVPADYDNAVKMAHLVKYLGMEVYDNLAADGIDFTRAYFPKMFYCTGTWDFRNNGTYVLGTAEGGKKIFLAGLNYLGSNLASAERLNHYYIKTIHHEFTHILNQTKSYSSDFKAVTSSSYQGDNWSEDPYDVDTVYLRSGFITAYSQKEDTEDFAEMVSVYITSTAEDWEALLVEAAKGDNDGTTGRELIEAKLEIVKEYMESQWGIDLDELRYELLRREADVISGKIDLDDLTVE